MSDTLSPGSSIPMPPEELSPAPTAAAKSVAAPQPRLWPAVVIVILEWLVITVPGWIVPGTMIHFQGMFLGPMVATAALVLWWLFFSRVPWFDRLFGLFAGAVLGAGAWCAYHPSFGIYGLIMYALPAVTLGWVLWMVGTPFVPWPIRRAGLVVMFLLVWGCFALFRFQGVDGNFSAEFRFRWSPRPEDLFQADLEAGRIPKKKSSDVKALTLQPGDWPGFRGPNRDGRLTGVRIATDWKQTPPRQLWRHRVGPGWSSFAVVGTRLYTQEQRGDDEAVVCYDTDSGAELWVHQDANRFTEVVSGPGPRATPTFHEGKIYALGPSGKLNCLDALTGSVVWSRDIVADSGAKVPPWGFAASPLVAQGVVTVFAGAPKGESVHGYDAVSGTPVWAAGDGKHSCCSLHPARLGGVEQLLIATDAGLTAFQPAKGEVLWRYDWQLDEGMARVIQPTVLDNGDVLIGMGMGVGTRRVKIGHEGDNWTTQQVWMTRAIKPYFNDVVIHKGHLYGFDNGFFTCVNLADGKGKWKVRGYDNGQVLLLADQDLLLVLSEKGAVAAVEANPEKHRELCRFQALEGKTWNHPVVAHGKLFVRNGEEAACYQLVEQPASE
jgi:outer membrane protein assembly factor BamB